MRDPGSLELHDILTMTHTLNGRQKQDSAVRANTEGSRLEKAECKSERKQ